MTLSSFKYINIHNFWEEQLQYNYYNALFLGGLLLAFCCWSCEKGGAWATPIWNTGDGSWGENGGPVTDVGID